MIIKKEIFEYIVLIANKENPEMGRMLGSSLNGIITDIVPDLPDKIQRCRFEYYPNIAFLNEEIEKWAEKSIEFLGMFHTHFSGYRDLSKADKKYINTIMQSVVGIVEYLYFPIFVLPDNELIVYKAYFIDSEIMIVNEKLEIV